MPAATGRLPIMTNEEIQSQCLDVASRARFASRTLATASGALKNLWLQRASHALGTATEAILAANARDLECASDFGLTQAQVDRLRLTSSRLRAAAEGLREIA